MVCDEKCIRQVSQYLNIPVGKLSFDKSGNLSVTTIKNQSVAGFATILLYLAKSSKISHFGKNDEDEAMVRQWIEYITCYGGCLESSLSRNILKEFNEVLSTQSYFVGHSKTLADVLGLSLQEKEQYLHLSRWFSNIQQDPLLRQKNRLLTFSRTPLYS